jgi:hypothetical protein
MSAVPYIVPTDSLSTNPPAGEWHAHVIPSDWTQSLVVVTWDNPTAETEYESRPYVLPLGSPWEPLPAGAAPLLASFIDAPLANNGATTPSLPSLDTPPTDTVGTALRKVPWSGARLAR